MASVSMAWAFSLDLYLELEVAQTASVDEINRAYRIMVLKHHPDRGGSTEKFKSIDAAHTVLLNPMLRLDFYVLLEHRKQDYERYHEHRTTLPELYEPMDKSPLDQVVMELLKFLKTQKQNRFILQSPCRQAQARSSWSQKVCCVGVALRVIHARIHR